MNQPSHHSPYDVLIAGAGITGLALAAALKTTLDELIVVVCDPTLLQRQLSGRAYAITAGPRRMLAALGVWPRLARQAQPIHEMIVTDSLTGEPVRPVFLNFSGELAPGEPFAHMVSSDALITVLETTCRELGVEFCATAVAMMQPLSSRAELTFANGMAWPTRLLVAADGARSPLREKAGIGVVGWPYQQSGIVATVRHARDHQGRAEEHFLPSGPFAMLPLCDDQGRGILSSIVWTERSPEAQRLVALGAADFMLELARRFGHRLGAIELIDQPQCFPLSLQIARQFIGPRLALIGDAAHLIHPIAGQGLNLGLRDVAALAEIVVEQARLGLDLGAPDLLRRYQRARRFDGVAMAAMTDQLNRLFSNDVVPLRLLRDFGLGLVDRMPAVKEFFIQEAAGIQQPHAKLLRGEPI
jgi:2-octaprenyl-6-methoxyphenol hydroxylase